MWWTEALNLLLPLLIFMSRNNMVFQLSVSKVNLMFLYKCYMLVIWIILKFFDAVFRTKKYIINMLFTDERYKFKGKVLKLNFFMVSKKHWQMLILLENSLQSQHIICKISDKKNQWINDPDSLKFLYCSLKILLGIWGIL